MQMFWASPTGQAVLLCWPVVGGAFFAQRFWRLGDRGMACAVLVYGVLAALAMLHLGVRVTLLPEGGGLV